MKREINRVIVFVCGMAFLCVGIGACIKKANNPTYVMTKSYNLVAAKFETTTELKGSFSGMFLIGGGSIETGREDYYIYWYQREDGGIIKENLTKDDRKEIIIYEDNSISPKVEIWKNDWNGKEEYRFTIPEGTFINTYDVQ